MHLSPPNADFCVLEMALCGRLRTAEPPLKLHWCAFNGGLDAWVDVGNKAIGVEALQAYLDLEPSQGLHIGDQFLRTGNDVAARRCSPCREPWPLRPWALQAGGGPGQA